MRVKLVHEQARDLVYEIRQIVMIAKMIGATGVKLTWENIGDPVAKGEPVPEWIRQHLVEVTRQDRAWAYSPSKGMDETREFLAAQSCGCDSVRIGPEDIVFYNGLGDAVAKLYAYLNRHARVLCPSPSYSIHSTHEGFHAGGKPLLYHLDPANGWLPDPDEIRSQVQQHPEVAGILLINPDNPTGLVWPRELIAAVVAIAREHGLFVIADEIYHRLTFGGAEGTLLSEVIGEVPGVSLKGISKEYPWPGSRCGWMEWYNLERDDEFKRWAASLYDAKMIEVCSTTMPQLTIPRVMADDRYTAHLQMRCMAYGARALEFAETFEGMPGIHAARPHGAFYAAVTFEEGLLCDRQHLTPQNEQAERILDSALTMGPLSPDKRFVLHLLAATGIVVVPMTGFTSKLPGFRMTLLEQDDQKRRQTLTTVKEKIQEYLASA